MSHPKPTRITCIAVILSMCWAIPDIANAQGLIQPSDAFPVIGGSYKAQSPTIYPAPIGPVDLRAMSLITKETSQTISPSLVGEGQFHIDSFFDVFTELSVDGGEFAVDSFFDVFVELTIDVPPGQTTGDFQTEIVSMNLTGDLPGVGPFIIRESPLQSSMGVHVVTQLNDGGLYHIDSFFDVFTELSVDGGQSWIPADNPTHLQLNPGPSPYVALDTTEQWQEALAENRVAAPSLEFWNDYMQSWQTPLEGDPYPENTFLPPQLDVWPGDLCPDMDEWPESEGLVMAWGDDQPGADDSYSSAWQYVYPIDPDLSNVTVSTDVLAPAGITVISFGMRDINGKIRGWYWNVGAAPGPGMIQTGLMTTISINTALTGTAAASPIAASYTSDAGFDITKVVDLVFDENFSWVASAPVPPPGTTDPKPWNYWYNLLITPNNDVKPSNPLKWSQPPFEIGQNIFLGWDEVSVRPAPPLLADDWICKDARPVTDVHWWGSFLHWVEPEMPLNVPVGFHLAIWTDKPKDPDNYNSFSHPQEMIWEHFCNNYEWNFAGYDKDPRKDGVDPADGDDVTVFDPLAHDACFQFTCYIPEDQWFHQEPLDNGQGRVYWLSIAAMYPDAAIPEYPWGWKTRPHYFNDDAVRIYSLADGSWPAGLGAAWGSGQPLEFPENISWDLAFELTTTKEPLDEPNPDLNHDGIVNLQDLAILAARYLVRWP